MFFIDGDKALHADGGPRSASRDDGRGCRPPRSIMRGMAFRRLSIGNSGQGAVFGTGYMFQSSLAILVIVSTVGVVPTIATLLFSKTSRDDREIPKRVAGDRGRSRERPRHPGAHVIKYTGPRIVTTWSTFDAAARRLWKQSSLSRRRELMFRIFPPCSSGPLQSVKVRLRCQRSTNPIPSPTGGAINDLPWSRLAILHSHRAKLMTFISPVLAPGTL